MPNIKSQIKRDRQNKKRREANLGLKTKIKSATKKFNDSVSNDDVENAKEEKDLLFKTLDKAAKKNIVHKNFVANRKSRASKMLNTLEVKSTPKEKKEAKKKD